MKRIFHGAGYEECSAKEFFLARGLINLSFSIIGSPIYGATELDGFYAYLVEVRGLQTKDGLLVRFFLWPCNYAAIDDDISESMIINDCIIQRPLVISPDDTMIFNKPRWVKLVLQDEKRGEIIMNGPSIIPLEANGEIFSSPGENACFWDTTKYRPDYSSDKGVNNWPVKGEITNSSLLYTIRHKVTNDETFILLENDHKTYNPSCAASPEDLLFLPNGKPIRPSFIVKESIRGPGSLLAKPKMPMYWEGIETGHGFTSHGGFRPTPFAGYSSWQSYYLASAYFPSKGIKRPRFKWKVVNTKDGPKPNIEVSGSLHHLDNVKVLIPPPENTPQSFFELFEDKDGIVIKDFILRNEQFVNEEYSDYKAYADSMMVWAAYDERGGSTNVIQRSKLKDAAPLIKKHLVDNNITCFYHFTDKENLESIKTNGGLYSWRYFEEHGIIIPRPGGNELSRRLDINHGLEDFVRLSFCKSHPMAYRLKQSGRELVLLKIKTDVALFVETLFSDMNATDKNHQHGSNYEDLLKVHLDAVKEEGLKKDDPRFKYHQAEVMVKSFIPLEYIINIEHPESL